MKKENLIGLLIYLIVFAAAIIYGFTVLRSHFDNSSFNDSVLYYAAYILITVLSGVLVTGILQEFGHFLGAKIGGYKILSWCLLYFTIFEENDKTKVKFKSYEGLTGETKIIPNYEKKEKPNPYPYLLYGTIFNLAWVAGCITVFSTYYKESGFNSDLAYFFLTCGIIALFSALYNIFPAKLDSVNDGYRLLKVKKGVEAFNASLLAENNIVLDNITHSDIVEESNKFIPEVALKNAYELMNDGQFNSADELLDQLLAMENELSKKMVAEVNSQKIFIQVMSKPIEEAKVFYEKEVPFSLRKELSNSSDLPSIRTYMLTSSLLEGSKSECLLALSKVLKAYKNTPSNKRELEASLYNKALDKIIESHPKWEEIPNYKLYS